MRESERKSKRVRNGMNQSSLGWVKADNHGS